MFKGKFVLLQLCEIWTLRSAARVNTEWWTLEVLGIFGCVISESRLTGPGLRVFSPLDGHPWVKCSSVRITTYQRGEWRRPCNFAVVLFECSETQNLGVLLTFWELPCRASPEEDFQPQQKKKDAFRVWAGLWGGVTSHLVEWASPWHPLESKHKLRSSDFTCRSSVQPILTQCTTTNTILRGKLHWEWKNTPRDTFQIYKTFHNNLQKLYWNTRWFKTIMICVCFIFLWFLFDFRN